MRRRNPNQARRKINKRVIPNIFTVLNMFLGFMAITQLIKGRLELAGWLIISAGAMDAIDGKLARLFGIPSKFGTEFDSFADTISFCVAPALLIYVSWVNGLPPLLAGIISFTPILFGTIRLARFNLLQEESPTSYFIGITTPLSALGLFSYSMFSQEVYGNLGDPRIGLFLAVMLGAMMISPIRFSKFPLLSFKVSSANTFSLVGVFATMIAIIIWKGLVIFPLFLIYVTWSIVNWMIHPHRFELDHTLFDDDTP